MAVARRSDIPSVGWGLSAIILSAIGLSFFALPILSIPISCAGAAAGVIGIIATRRQRGERRASIAGLVLAGLALAIVLSIVYAPFANFSSRTRISVLQPESGRPYVPPPAPLQSMTDAQPPASQ